MDYLSKSEYSVNKQRCVKECIKLVLVKSWAPAITSYEDSFFQKAQKKDIHPRVLTLSLL